ncbi:right-handed parallel beta-helix repeat-containing protein [Microbacterium sp. P05]|uniref:right-handed parallel beta-helix repeat-containing protein n=1 Tax=Microbacterium sp. P05 TaxID=3366948 RepID=UPI0037471260
MHTRNQTRSSLFRAVLVVAAVALSATALPTMATALSPAVVSAEGAALAGSIQQDGDFTVNVAAPDGAKVKFKLDGAYLGQDASAPYSWSVHADRGAHTVNVRWEGDAGRQEVDVAFTVGASTPSSPLPSATPRPSPTASTSPTPGPTPPVSGNSVAVSSTAQLTAALKAAKPGQTIALADGTYTGAFIAAAAGTTSQPITLTGSRRAVLTTGKVSSEYGLHVTGTYWNLTGFSVTTAAKGIVLDGASHTIIDGVDVGNTGAEAVHVRKNSVSVIVRNSTVHDTGRVQAAYGEGIYIGSAKSNWSSVMGSPSSPDRSDYVQILDNTIVNTTAEGIDIKEGTTGGVVSGNVFTNAGYSGENYGDSWMDVKGNGYRITGNSGSTTLLDAFQVHVAIVGWGRDNIFRGNLVRGGVPGFEVSVQSGAVGTVVGCGPTAAGRGLSNIACTP